MLAFFFFLFLFMSKLDCTNVHIKPRLYEGIKADEDNSFENQSNAHKNMLAGFIQLHFRVV